MRDSFKAEREYEKRALKVLALHLGDSRDGKRSNIRAEPYGMAAGDGGAGPPISS